MSQTLCCSFVLTTNISRHVGNYLEKDREPVHGIQKWPRTSFIPWGRLIIRIADPCQLAPSGGWLASLVIPICQTTGIYDFTILGALYTYLFIFFRSASCEAAIVIGLGFDVTIPCQYLSKSSP